MRPPEWLPLPTMTGGHVARVPWPSGIDAVLGRRGLGIGIADHVDDGGEGLDVGMLARPRVDDGDGDARALSALSGTAAVGSLADSRARSMAVMMGLHIPT